MPTEQPVRSKTPARRDRLIAAVAIAAILALYLAPPHGLLDKADQAAFAVCHRLPDRTFTVAGRPLPLCARCSGTYLGVLAGLAVLTLRGRGRASMLPAPQVLAVFGVFLAAWAVDGLNSFLTLFPGLPHLYEPHNLLRLATGILEGLAIAALMLPAFNRSLWAKLPLIPSVESWQDIAWMLVGGALVAGVVASERPFLLYPLALLSGIAVVMLLGAVNTVFVLLVLRRDGQMTRWRQAAAPLLAGLAAASIELTLVGIARTGLEAWLGTPW
jgi:uncharacterized membrane protein